MKKIILWSIVIALISLQCSGPKKMSEVYEGEVPSWFLNPPKNSGYVYAARTAVSMDMQLALEKATMSARAEVGRQIESKIKELQKRFIEETGADKNLELTRQFAIATKSVVNITLNGSKVKEQSYEQDGKFWRAYVLVEYPIGKARRNFLRSINNDEKLKSELKATELFKELASEIK